MLPKGYTLLIITDAGYRNTWFTEVDAYGWYWLDRLRGEVCYKLNEQWALTKTLYAAANNKARYIGTVQIARKEPMPCHLYAFKSKDKHRKDKRSRRSGNNHFAKTLYHRSAKEPWVLATNLPPKLFYAVQITTL